MRRFLWLIMAGCLVLPSAVLAQENLLKNPGFENGGEHWGKFGTVGFESWAAETGEHGAALWGWVMNGEGGFFQSVAAQPGRTYTFSIRAKKEARFEAEEVYIKLEFYASDDATRSGHDQGLLNVAALLTGDWKTYTVQGTAPAGTAFVRPVFGFLGATVGDLGSGQQACFFDDAYLKVEPEEP